MVRWRNAAIALSAAGLGVLLVIGQVAAQAAPLRVVRAGDGTLYLIRDGGRYTIAPEPITDHELAGIPDRGPLAPTQPPAIFAVPASAQPPSLPDVPLDVPLKQGPPSVPTPLPTSTATRTPGPAPTLGRTGTPTPAPTQGPKVSEDGASFGDGVFKVGPDIPSATYRARDVGAGCAWSRLKGTSGSPDDVIASDQPRGPALVAIASTDVAFSSKGCGRWSTNLAPITANQTAAFGEGTYIVNTDVAPGTWRATGGDTCTWARLRGFDGTSAAVVASESPRGSATVVIAQSDAGFTSRGCGAWTKVA